MADIKRPNAILVGVDGSAFFLLRKAKKATSNGVSKITHPGFIDWLNRIMKEKGLH
jgi:hypothetical protein